jgi:hypothetical protein
MINQVIQIEVSELLDLIRQAIREEISKVSQIENEKPMDIEEAAKFLKDLGVQSIYKLTSKRDTIL